jgi:hypothetical protein
MKLHSFIENAAVFVGPEISFKTGRTGDNSYFVVITNTQIIKEESLYTALGAW